PRRGGRRRPRRRAAVVRPALQHSRSEPPRRHAGRRARARRGSRRRIGRGDNRSPRPRPDPRLTVAVPARKPRKVLFTFFGVPAHMPRGPRRFFSEVSGGEALLPLIVLVGLNGVNQLDQTGFGILAPDIRDQFHLSDGQFLTLTALTLIGGLL